MSWTIQNGWVRMQQHRSIAQKSSSKHKRVESATEGQGPWSWRIGNTADESYLMYRLLAEDGWNKLDSRKRWQPYSEYPDWRSLSKSWISMKKSNKKHNERTNLNWTTRREFLTAFCKTVCIVSYHGRKTVPYGLSLLHCLNKNPMKWCKWIFCTWLRPKSVLRYVLVIKDVVNYYSWFLLFTAVDRKAADGRHSKSIAAFVMKVRILTDSNG